MGRIDIIYPVNGVTVSMMTEKQREFVLKPDIYTATGVDWLNLRAGSTDLSYAEPVEFLYSPSIDGVIVIEDTDNRHILSVNAALGRALVNNLFIGAEYRWRVEADGVVSDIGVFKTDALPPRVLTVDGISNVRDTGGFISVKYGRAVRQGLLYRTSELNSHIEITEKGKHTLENELMIRTDLDLRGSAEECMAILDPGKVDWINISLHAYESVFREENLPAYGQVFRLLSEEERYPMIVHCWGGIDRTGTLLFILGALLGVNEEDLCMDYEFSSFSRWGSRSRYSDQFRAFLDRFHTYGEDTCTCAENFLNSCGITGEEIESIRRIFLY